MRRATRGVLTVITVALLAAVTGIGTRFGLGVDRAEAAPGQVAPEASSTIYTVRDDGTVRVDVTATIAAREQCPAGFVCYFSAMVVPVPTAAVNLSSDAGSVVTEPQNRFYQLAVVRLANRLTTGQTRTTRLSYDIVSGPRANAFVRTNRAYVQFYAFGIGDPGRVDVTVNVPRAFDVGVALATMTRTSDGTTTVLRQLAIADPTGWTAAITARNDGALVRTELAVDGRSVVVRSWPGDDDWARYVASQVRGGMPTLRRLIARAVSKRATLTITESAAPYLYGYAGWYTASDNTIEVGDELDATVLFHEISHEWFNKSSFVDRWVDEGLAQEFSTRAVLARRGRTDTPIAPQAKDSGRIALDRWSAPDVRDSLTDAQERYGYNASFWVMRELAAELGAARFRTVIDAALDREYAYRTTSRPERDPTVVGWRRLLDLFDMVGNSKRADALFAQYVVAPADRQELADRAEARARYARLVRASAPWLAPVAVRTPMNDWSFAAANDRMTVAQQILAVRDEMTKLLAPVGVNLPATLATRYARDRDLAPLLGDMRALRTGASQLVAAHAEVGAGRSLVQRIGLVGADPQAALRRADAAFTRGDVATATRELTAATRTIAGASSAGWKRLLATGGAVAGIVVVVLLVVRWRRRRARRRLASPPLPSPDGAILSPAPLVSVGPPPSAPAPFVPPPSPAPPPPSPDG